MHLLLADASSALGAIDHIVEVVFEPRFRALGLNIHNNLLVTVARSAAGLDSHAASICNA